MVLQFQILNKKASLFNSNIFSQCIPINTSSKLPVFAYKMENHSANIKEEHIHPIIKNLFPDKTHGWDDISIKMIKFCDKSVVFPLKLLSQSSLECGYLERFINIRPIFEVLSKLTFKFLPISWHCISRFIISPIF